MPCGQPQCNRVLPKVCTILRRWKYAGLLRVFQAWQDWYMISRRERLAAQEIAERETEYVFP